MDKISATLAGRNPFQSRGNRSSCSGHLGLRHLQLRGRQEGALSRLEDLVHRPFYLALHWISRRLASIRHIPLFQVTLYYSLCIELEDTKSAFVNSQIRAKIEFLEHTPHEAFSFIWRFHLYLHSFPFLTSKYGKLKLGKANEKPEFSDVSWFVMLFACGVGIGMFFYGVAEAVVRYCVKVNIYQNTGVVRVM